MVKGGTKRKIDIKKITNKRSKATTFSKRLNGLYSKASQLCILTGGQIAILSAPPSQHSNVPFYSFGHSSVDAVVSAFLSGQSLVPASEDSKEMREDFGICLARSDLGLGHWWDAEGLNPGEINDAIESIKSLLNQAKRFRTEEALPHQTLITDDDDLLHQTLITDNDDLPANFNAEHDKILSVSDNNNALSPAGNLDEWSDMDIGQLLQGFDDDLPENLDEKTEQQDHHIVAVTENCCDHNNALLLDDIDLSANFNAEHDKILSISDNNNALSPAGNLDEWSDMDIDQLLQGFDDDLPENLDEKTEQGDHQIVAATENCCNNNNEALLPAGNFDDDDEQEVLDFESICEGLEDLDYLMRGY